MQPADPADYQPPLTLWGHIWRSLLVFGICLIVWFNVAERQSDEQFMIDVVLGVPAWLLVFFRRRWPMPVAVVTAVLGAVSSFAAGPATLAAVSVATRRRWREVIPIALLTLVSGMLWAYVQPMPREGFWLELGTNAAVVAAIVAWGMFIGSRRELLWTLRQRAERAEAEQAARVREGRTAERTRIAREMHDVLAHRISQISMRAGALGYRGDLDPADVRAGLGLIQTQAQDALNDLRSVLGVLREQDGRPLHTPQPTYADLPELVEHASRWDGAGIEFDDGVTADRPVPDLAGRTLYRIVQETITNAHKHAPGARLRIELRGTPEEGISFDISNPLGFGSAPAAPGSGLGLVGLTERAVLAGGRLEHGAIGDQFRVRGWIPWTA